MEHMKMRWVARPGSWNRWVILTDEPEPWCVAEVFAILSGDMSGELTCRAICDEHNKALELTEIKEGGR